MSQRGPEIYDGIGEIILREIGGSQLLFDGGVAGLEVIGMMQFTERACELIGAQVGGAEREMGEVGIRLTHDYLLERWNYCGRLAGVNSIE